MELRSENYQLKWHSFGTHLHSCVAAALNGDYFTDVALLTVDGRQIMAHRFILSACSQYLHQVLKLQAKVSIMGPVIIVLPPEITYKTLKVLIQYMYSGEATVSQDILESVLRGGDLLKVKGLWRPREEECIDKRNNVRVQQKTGNVLSPTPPPLQPILPEHSVIKDPKQITKPQKSVLKPRDDLLKPLETTEKIVNKDTVMPSPIRTPTPLVTPPLQTTKPDSVIKTTNGENHPKEIEDGTNDIGEGKENKDLMQILVIKEEPIEWSEINQEEIELVEQEELFDSEMVIKPEVHIDDSEQSGEELYTPLTCELCSETFTIPAEWVKHVQTHTDMMPAKRQKRGRPSDDDMGNFPPLQCDMCQEYFPTPAKWVQHIQFAHTEQEMQALNANAKGTRPIKPSTNRHSSPTHKICSVCDKKFPSHASMLIHKRTHTGERPYMCDYCCKGFNVKSNLLRHLRTLHDKYVNPTDIESKEEEAPSGDA